MKPLFDSLRAYSARSEAVFHMPGHKLGRGFTACPGFGDAAILDVTELPDTDDLYNPKGPIKEAQELAAAAFGAGRTWFLTNGSSVGIHAMISSVCHEGGKLLIARDFHYSAYNAMSFARVKPVYIPVRGAVRAAQSEDCVSLAPIPPKSQFCVLTPDDVRDALDGNPDASAVYITRPNYFGCVCDIAAISALTRERGIPLLVDEAHGAHFVFSERLPVCAMSSGASLCVQSAHKTLPALTQSGYLHASVQALAGDQGLSDRIAVSCRAFQTSSPSFILMASLDCAREYMEERGAAELSRVESLCVLFAEDMERLGYRTLSCGCGCDSGSDIGNARHTRDVPVRHTRDITRIVLNTESVGISGRDTQRLLDERYNIGIEMSDREHIVMIATVSDRERDFELLSEALTDIARIRNSFTRALTDYRIRSRALTHIQEPKISVFATPATPATPAKVAADAPSLAIVPDFIKMLHTPKINVPLSQSANMLSAGLVTPYPPGIPALCPGERIDSHIISSLLEQHCSGTQITGLIG